jgi:hypothetical protein
MGLMTYLHRTPNGTYGFRRIIPAKLRPHMPPPWTGKREWKKSLGTKAHAEAKRLAIPLYAQSERAFAAAESALSGKPATASIPYAITFTPEEIEESFYAELMAEDEAFREEGDARRQLQTAEERAAMNAALREATGDSRASMGEVRFGEKGLSDDATGFQLQSGVRFRGPWSQRPLFLIVRNRRGPCGARWRSPMSLGPGMTIAAARERPPRRLVRAVVAWIPAASTLEEDKASSINDEDPM